MILNKRYTVRGMRHVCDRLLFFVHKFMYDEKFNAQECLTFQDDCAHLHYSSTLTFYFIMK